MGSEIGESGAKDLGTVSFPLERAKLLELARSFKDPDPVWFDAEAAKAAGFDELPVPPTATVIADHWRDEGATFHAQAAGLDLSRVLHGEVSWEFLRPLRGNDELTATSVLAGTETRQGKRGGEMKLVRVETTYVDGAGEVAARRVDTLVETAPK
jgi:hypothetical protein